MQIAVSPADEADVLGRFEPIARAMFARPRPYTVAALGGLDLVLTCLQVGGHEEVAQRFSAAVQPLLDVTGAEVLTELPDRLGHAGRPPRSVSQALRTDELETALTAAFTTLGWDSCRPFVASWSPMASGATDEAQLSAAEQLDRRQLVLELARRVREIEATWSTQRSRWDLRMPELDKRRLRGAYHLLGLPFQGALTAASVPVAARWPNRVGRALAQLAVAKLDAALAGHAPEDALRWPVAVLAAVAEAVSHQLWPREQHRLLVPAEGSPVAPRWWSPDAWWPTLDAWGSREGSIQRLFPTSWRLRPAEADVALWSIMWSLAWLGTAAAAPQRPDDAAWREHVDATVDPEWGLRLSSAWDLAQSTRAVSKRTPWPSPFGSAAELARVSWVESTSLPWTQPVVGVDAEDASVSAPA